jgi:hypothetical protein
MTHNERNPSPEPVAYCINLAAMKYTGFAATRSEEGVLADWKLLLDEEVSPAGYKCTGNHDQTQTELGLFPLLIVQPRCRL